MGLAVEVGGVILKNPLILGSAGYTSSENGIKRYIKRGYSAVVTKTFTKEPRVGAPSPTVFWFDPVEKTMLCGDEALKNPGAEKAAEAIAASKSLAVENNCLIIASLTGSTLDEILYLSKTFEEAGADILEINMICPATGKHLGEDYVNLGKYWVRDSIVAAETIKSIKNAVNIPVWPKITLEKLLIQEFIKDLDNKAKPDAYSFVGGRVPVLAIDIHTGKPRFPGNTRLQIEQKMPIMPITTGPTIGATILHTAYLSKLTSTPLICSGGLTTGEHLIQCLMVGAAAVQICSVVYKDRKICEAILNELEQYVKERGLKSIADIRGASLQFIPSPPLLKVPPALG